MERVMFISKKLRSPQDTPRSLEEVALTLWLRVLTLDPFVPIVPVVIVILEVSPDRRFLLLEGNLEPFQNRLVAVGDIAIEHIVVR